MILNSASPVILRREKLPTAVDAAVRLKYKNQSKLRQPLFEMLAARYTISLRNIFF
ncbi:MAG: hypothetical protein LBT46_04450 [Planctomycetaceae bacterium]|nr:hypothetical protein [Planctomycetaceae bacterium]